MKYEDAMSKSCCAKISKRLRSHVVENYCKRSCLNCPGNFLFLAIHKILLNNCHPCYKNITLSNNLLGDIMRSQNRQHSAIRNDARSASPTKLYTRGNISLRLYFSFIVKLLNALQFLFSFFFKI